MAQQITNYQCPACTGPLHFAEDIGKLKCDFCDSTFTVEEIEAHYAQQDQTHAEAEADWDKADMTEDWGEDAEGLKIYTCPSCAAELICDETTGASACPYCGNPTIIPSAFHGVLKPDYIIPFKLDKNAAVNALRDHYKKKFLLPKVFKEENHLQEIKGIYVPFWLYDATVNADCSYDANKSFTRRTGDYIIKDTDHYTVTRRGSVSFSKVPVDGSKKMDNDYMDSIEPYQYEELTAFSTAYLPGYMADRYDEDIDMCAERANRRCEASAIEEIQKTVTGYDMVMPKSQQAKMKRGKVSYALLPVWTLHTKWQDKDYIFMMNGQTGKMVGDLPISKSKQYGLTAAVWAGGTILFTILPIGRLIANIILGFF